VNKPTPLDIFLDPSERLRLQLGQCEPSTNPFANREALSETYLFGVIHDQVEMRLAMLLGIWTSLSPPTTGNVGLLLFAGVSEFGWKAVEWDIPSSPHWWTILEYTQVSLSESPRVDMMPLDGWVPLFDDNPTPSRFRFMLSPASEAIVSFRSAVYLIGTQSITEDDLRARFVADTGWHAICEWPT
jgi:hypothetical protein